MVHLIPSWLVWAEIECSVHLGLPKQPINLFKPVQQIRQKVLRVDTVQDFLIVLDMKPCLHLVEISIFSLNNVAVRLTKIMNNLLEHLKILIFKVIFQCWKLVDFFQKKISLKNIGVEDQLLPKKDLEIFYFWSNLFSRKVPNFCRLSS